MPTSVLISGAWHDLAGMGAGGTPLSTEERVPERIRTLIYVAAALLPSGTALSALAGQQSDHNGILGRAPVALPRLHRKARAAYSSTPHPPNGSSTRSNGLGPMKVFETPLALTDERYGGVARAYVQCTQDRALPITAQRAMQERLPCNPIITLNTDHSPFFSSPDELVAALNPSLKERNQSEGEHRVGYL